MEGIFKPDIFSDSQPKWTMGSSSVSEELRILMQYLPTQFRSGNSTLEYSGGLEINSSNLKFSSNGQTILLKRWSKNAKNNTLDRILNMMNWLADNHLPVPRPLCFLNGESLIKINEFYWSYYPFFEGNYFSGKGVEIYNAAQITAKLTSALSGMPVKLYPEEGPLHLTKEDDEIIELVSGAKGKWNDFFGPQYAELLREAWPNLIDDWHRLRDQKTWAGPKMPVHFDLHPHNLIFTNFEISAILDFEACKLMPVGYALAFAGLKQCRQAVAYNNDVSAAGNIGRNYIKKVSENFKISEPIFEKFSDLALTEIIRRLCIIFRLNFLNGNKEWNKVLPVQLAHLYEAKLLFKN